MFQYCLLLFWEVYTVQHMHVFSIAERKGTE